jgi:hypothetical protein
MTFLRRQQTSLDAYLNLLENKGADADNLARRRDLLEKLLPFLAKKPVKSEYFRNAVDEALTEIDKNDWPFFLAIVRDFHYFWINDFKAIAALQKSGGLHVSPELPQTPEGSLKNLWEQLSKEKFSITEKWPLNAYKHALKNEGLENEAVEVRVKMAQLLLLQLRKVDGKSGTVYRLAVESMLPVFLKKETSELFLWVVREFFHFWLGDPNATECLSEHTENPNTLW